MKNLAIFLISIISLSCFSLCFISILNTKIINSFSTQGDANSNEEKRCTYTASVVYDTNGIPSYDYGTVEGTYIGLQRSPITIAQEALRFDDEYLDRQQC